MRYEKKSYELPMAKLFMIPTDDIISCSNKKTDKKDNDRDTSIGEWDIQD